jgi:hypothetical protein
MNSKKEPHQQMKSLNPNKLASTSGLKEQVAIKEDGE